METFKDWRDIKNWATEHGFVSMAKRMQINNDCWNSSGEFGRSQVAICDAMRFCETEAERIETADRIEQELLDDWITNSMEGSK